MTSFALRVAQHVHRSVAYGTPKGPRSWKDMTGAPGITWMPLNDADKRPSVAPINLGQLETRLAEMALPIPPLGVFQFKNGRAIADGGFCFTEDGIILRETTWHDASLTSKTLPKSFRKPQFVEGTCLSLLSEFSAFNFGHYLLDTLSRLEIARRAGFPPEKLDWIYLERPPSDTARLVLDAHGVKPEQCIWADDTRSVIASNLLVTTFPGTKRNYAKLVPEALRRPAKGDEPARTRKVFIPRKGVRKLTNDHVIEQIARDAGLEIYDFRQVDNECEFFREVDLAVGPHGSDLSVIAFCQPGAKVLELIPSDHVHPYFYTLGIGAGLDYYYLAGASEHDRPDQEAGPSPYDFTIDPDEFRDALEQLT